MLFDVNEQNDFLHKLGDFINRVKKMRTIFQRILLILHARGRRKSWLFIHHLERKENRDLITSTIFLTSPKAWTLIYRDTVICIQMNTSEKKSRITEY